MHLWVTTPPHAPPPPLPLHLLTGPLLRILIRHLLQVKSLMI